MPVFCYLLVSCVLGVPWKRAAVALITAGICLNATTGALRIWKTDPWDYWLGKETKRDFVARNVDVYPIYEAANQILSAEDKLYLVDMKNYGYWLEIPYEGDYVFERYTLASILKKAKKPEQVFRFFAEKGITYISLNRHSLLSGKFRLEKDEAEMLVSFLNEWTTPAAIHGNYALFKINREKQA